MPECHFRAWDGLREKVGVGPGCHLETGHFPDATMACAGATVACGVKKVARIVFGELFVDNWVVRLSFE